MILIGLLTISREEKLFTRFLSGIVVLGITDEICQTFGKLRAEQRKVGVIIDNFDLLIASTALVHDLTILTDNVKHFKKIKGIKIKSSK